MALGSIFSLVKVVIENRDVFWLKDFQFWKIFNFATECFHLSVFGLVLLSTEFKISL